MEYQVPQFLEVEDKIFGPFTFKQFIYVGGGIGICVVLILYLPLFLGILLALPIGALAAALAFYKVNNKPFADIMESAFKYYLGDHLYLWKKGEPKAKEAAKAGPAAADAMPERAHMGLSRGKLEELAWSLDSKDKGTDA